MRDAHEWGTQAAYSPTRPRNTRTDGAPEVLRLSKKIRGTGGSPVRFPMNASAILAGAP